MVDTPSFELERFCFSEEIVAPILPEKTGGTFVKSDPKIIVSYGLYINQRLSPVILKPDRILKP